MTPQRWERTGKYLREVFGREDQHLAGLMPRAIAAGLPDIAISSDVGRLLKLLASMTNGGKGAELIVELGMLGGYSTIWLARGLAPGGRVITIELEDSHANFAADELTLAGVADRVEIRRGAALQVLPGLAAELGSPRVDLAFIDAVKVEYPEYFRLLRPLIRPGGLFVADNALGSSWWIDDQPGSSPERDAVDRMNRAVAADHGFEAVCLPIRQGILVARRHI